MKVFNLKCEHGHPFEGWFESHEAFAQQQSKGLLECPLCNSHQVEKALSAPRLNLSADILSTVRKALAESEDVGDRFADEARSMHAKETPQRSIHGQTSLLEARELIEEGIPVFPLPFAKAAKNPLQ